MLTSVIIGGFDLLLHALPSNLARWLSSILTSRSYHTCVYLLLFIGSFILLYSCMMCYSLAHPINLFLIVIVLHYAPQCIYSLYLFITPCRLPLIYAWMFQHSIKLYYGSYTLISYIDIVLCWSYGMTAHIWYNELFYLIFKIISILIYVFIICLFVIAVDSWYVISFINCNTWYRI